MDKRTRELLETAASLPGQFVSVDVKIEEPEYRQDISGHGHIESRFMCTLTMKCDPEELVEFRTLIKFFKAMADEGQTGESQPAACCHQGGSDDR